MNLAKQMLIGAAFSLALLGSPARGADVFKVPGLWKLVEFHTEDVDTKERSRLYGERPIGFMELETNGRLSAWIASCWPVESALSVWEDAATSLDGQLETYRAVFYSGKYRLDGTKFLVRLNKAEHEGWVGTDAFDLTWSEGLSQSDEVRRYGVQVDAREREILHIETAPMQNPNGVGNTIIGRLIWARTSSWEFGRPN